MLHYPQYYIYIPTKMSIIHSPAHFLLSIIAQCIFDVYWYHKYWKDWCCACSCDSPRITCCHGSIVEPPNNRYVGGRDLVLYREVALLGGWLASHTLRLNLLKSVACGRSNQWHVSQVVEVCIVQKCNTVELPIMDPLRSVQPLYNGQTTCSRLTLP